VDGGGRDVPKRKESMSPEGLLPKIYYVSAASRKEGNNSKKAHREKNVGVGFSGLNRTCRRVGRSAQAKIEVHDVKKKKATRTGREDMDYHMKRKGASPGAGRGYSAGSRPALSNC